MRSQNLALALLVLLLVLTALSGVWLWRRVTGTLPPAGRPSPAATETAPPEPTPTAAAQAPPGYRLAGVAVGDTGSFAVIEAPTGRHTLYRVDAEVPGLGRLVHVEAEHVVIASKDGQFDLWVAPAPTVTPTRGRSPTPRAAGTPKPTAKPQPAPVGGGTAPGSSP